jgi:hydroxyacylglutathione hydrolase
MLLKYFQDTDLAQNAYFIGCPDTGEALVIDPARDITPYLDFAREKGLRIIGAAETHIHADYVSGGRELAHAVKGTLFVSDYGGELGYQINDPQINVVRVRESDHIKVGQVRLDVLYTPGHTPEHICYVMTDGGAEQPFGIFTGDCLFVGDMGRPDLLETAAGSTHADASKEGGARRQFASMLRFKSMPEYLTVLPGHGAGSACGKALGEIPTSTLGYEKLFNPAFQMRDEGAFVKWLLADQPVPPRYFKQMKQVNQVGAALLDTLKYPRPVIYDSEILLASKALLIDTRPKAAFAAGHIPDSINIPADESQFSTWVGWFVDYDQPLYLVVSDAALRDVVRRLRAIGVDHIMGYVRDEVAMRYKTITRQVSVETAAEKREQGAVILDVRDQSERKEAHIPDSLYIPMGEIPKRLNEIPREGEVIVQCASGVRSQIVASLLQKQDFRNVLNLDGGMDAWKKAGYPVDTGALPVSGTRLS